ncbi:dTMP kinase [Candidatus Gottesmanbacteria bacterium]|nr:dTMP kinase [Candidatus Gottesmanbacteria bacterium]
MQGFFISFEGVEGSGKSTQVGLLASRLREAGKNIVVTREPGGTRIGELIREITHSKDNVDLTAVAETYLMSASRAQHVREIIKPALQIGKIVICDRFIDSSLAYQGYGRELGEEVIEQLNKLALDSIMPDLTILLDVIPKIGFARRNQTDKIDRLDLQKEDFYNRVYTGYQRIAKKFKGRFYIVDSINPISEVADIIWEKVKTSIK